MLLVVLAVIVIIVTALYFKFKLPALKRDMSPNKRAVLVTGAGSGIGLECVKQFLSSGSIVFACDMNEKALADLAKNKNCITIKLDVTSKSDLTNAETLVKQQLDSLKNDGRLLTNELFAVVNCAGIPKLTRVALVEKDDSELEKTFSVNVFGTHRVNKIFYPMLQKDCVGCIINIASVLGSTAVPFGGFYSASKYAIKGYVVVVLFLTNRYTDTLRRELIGRVRVTCINPGFTATPMVAYTSNLSVGGSHGEMILPTEFNNEMEAMRLYLLERFIMRFLQTPDKVAEMIVASVFSSNNPGHVLAEAFLIKRILWFFTEYNFIVDTLVYLYWPKPESETKKTK